MIQYFFDQTKTGRQGRAGLHDLHRLCWVALMAALVAAGALLHLSIGPVPITFQEFFLILGGLVLGPRYGTFMLLLYLFAGAVGLPVFSGGRAGLGHLIGPTGGYFLGQFFLVVCSGMGARAARRLAARRPGIDVKAGNGATGSSLSPESGPASETPSGPAFGAASGSFSGPNAERSASVSGFFPLLAALAWIAVGLVFEYGFGAAWLMHTLEISPVQAASVGVLPFLPLAAGKAVCAVLLWRSLDRRGLLPS